MSTILGVQNFGGLKIFDLKNFCRVNILGSVLLRVNSFEGQKFSGIPFLVGSKFQGSKFFEVTILQGTNILGIQKLQGSKKYWGSKSFRLKILRGQTFFQWSNYFWVKIFEGKKLGVNTYLGTICLPLTFFILHFFVSVIALHKTSCIFDEQFPQVLCSVIQPQECWYDRCHYTKAFLNHQGLITLLKNTIIFTLVHYLAT